MDPRHHWQRNARIWFQVPLKYQRQKHEVTAECTTGTEVYS